MLLYCEIRRHTLGRSLLFTLLLATIAGCDSPREKKSGGERVDCRKTSGLHTELTSANDYLDASDLEKFRPGRSKNDILKDVQWRGNFLMACMNKGKNVCAIAYKLLFDGPSSDRGKVVWAIFVDDKFVKFVPWQKGDMEEVPYEGTMRSRPKPIKVGDCYGWLIRAVESAPVNIADLEKEVKSLAPPPSQIDPGLTAAWLILRAMGATPTPATEDDYKKNAELRDQFNAARLKIGMTEAEVESVLKAKPLESGKVEVGSYKIYGSNESFNIDNDYSLHFWNVLVVFREGKVSVIYSFPARTDWRQKLRERFVDLPEER